jgi:hypothetical protein
LIVLSQSTDLLYARHVVPHNPMKEKEREKKENTFYVVPSLSDGAHEVAERFDHGAVISSRWRFNSNLPPRPFPSTLLDGRRGININCVGESPLFFSTCLWCGYAVYTYNILFTVYTHVPRPFCLPKREIRRMTILTVATITFFIRQSHPGQP